jgi:dTDP-4-amino-4,6-dideoxy-D-galactose acyltransferase
MIKVYKYLPWDSSFFGFSIGEMSISNLKCNEITNLLQEISNLKLKLVYLYPLDIESIKALSNSQIPHVDNKLTFIKSVNQLNFINISCIVSYNKRNDFNKLLKLALESGKYSRFKKDKNFGNKEFARLYTEWIQNSINGKIADEVLVYNLGVDVAGFVTYKSEADKIVIGLIAVDTKYKRIGIGTSLMQTIENIAVQTGKEKIEVSTQEANFKAVSFYKHLGYELKHTKTIFHLWMQ